MDFNDLHSKVVATDRKRLSEDGAGARGGLLGGGGGLVFSGRRDLGGQRVGWKRSVADEGEDVGEALDEGQCGAPSLRYGACLRDEPSLGDGPIGQDRSSLR